MGYSDIISACKESLKELNGMVTAIEREVTSEGSGVEFIRNNVNFFTKSFLITLCSLLETCIKDSIHSVAEEIDIRLSAAAIPSAIVEWKYRPKKKKDENPGESEAHNLEAGLLKIRMSKKDVDDLVSGNVYKTKDTFLLVGVDLTSDKAEWNTRKEIIQSIVTKRNNIVHHNDDASDLSLGDIRGYIQKVEEYLDFINKSCISANK
jgi:hypothetical protein